MLSSTHIPARIRDGWQVEVSTKEGVENKRGAYLKGGVAENQIRSQHFNSFLYHPMDPPTTLQDLRQCLSGHVKVKVAGEFVIPFVKCSESSVRGTGIDGTYHTTARLPKLTLAPVDGVLRGKYMVIRSHSSVGLVDSCHRP